ncbi:UNVERIFIED_CONTAM: putative ribonuclease H protein [Sesamum latifolium]|uniref:Ribonuclease H protein n=1 Tax=Sesamum latifolium TaxID=2727402 RepID=A0AAW2TM34_9LAMI
MTALAWNYRGLGATSIVHKLGEYIREVRPLIVFLSETKCGQNKFVRVRKRLDMFGISVPSRGKSGGLALLWDKSIVVQLRSYSVNHIDADILLGGQVANWRFTGFYGEPETAKQREVLDKLVQLSTQSDAPWLCMGDYNEILFQHKKIGNARPQWQISDFRTALERSELCDLGFQGPKYTWCNGRVASDTVRARLDWACGNVNWCRRFPNTNVIHRPVPYSDYAMLIVHWESRWQSNIVWRKPLFRFEAKWQQSDECGKVIESAWGRDAGTDPNVRVWKNIQFCRLGLLQWNREVFTKSVRDIKILEKRFGELETGTLGIKEHKEMEVGEWRDKEEDIQEILLQYFRHTFSSGCPSDAAINEVLFVVQPRVTTEMNRSLAEPFTAAEVKQATFGMYPLKSPGPDGMPPLFFQKFWPVVGSDVTSAVLCILNDQVLLNKMNHTHVVLIPKCSAPKTVAQLHPISLCNVIVKIASKCIANCLKPLPDSIISYTQSAFIQGRLITDNVWLAFELNHHPRISTRSKEESFSCLVQQMEREGRLTGVMEVRRILEMYASASGHHVNYNKSCMMISGRVAEREKHQLTSILGVQCVTQMDRYLGLPAVGGRSRGEMFRGIRERIADRIFGWNAKLLSQAGKGVLISSVIQSIPTYVMSCFQLPLFFLRNIESSAADFWWHNKGEKQVHWVAWRKLCRTKDTGGLGFRSMREFNLALLAKQGWRILCRLDSLLSRVLQARQAVAVLERNVASSSGSSLQLAEGKGTLWTALWRTWVPPKVRVFMWRLCVEALPTLEKLAKRKEGVEKRCAICGGTVESIKHVLLECPFMRQVWALSYLPWRFVANWHHGAAKSVLSIVQRTSIEDRNQLFMYCWGLWKHRCKCLMEGKI